MAHCNIDDIFGEIHVLLKSKRYAAVLKILLNPETGNLYPTFSRDRNHAWYCVGDAFFKTNDFSAAKKAFKRSLSFRLDDADALQAIGNCYDALNCPRLAERYFRKALAVPSQIKRLHQAEITFNLANALYDQGRFEEGGEVYGNLIGSHPSVGSAGRKNLHLAVQRIRQRNQPL